MQWRLTGLCIQRLRLYNSITGRFFVSMSTPGVQNQTYARSAIIVSFGNFSLQFIVNREIFVRMEHHYSTNKTFLPPLQIGSRDSLSLQHDILWSSTGDLKTCCEVCAILRLWVKLVFLTLPFRLSDDEKIFLFSFRTVLWLPRNKFGPQNGCISVGEAFALGGTSQEKI